MATYAVTFRIADQKVFGKTYQERYEAMIDNIHQEGVGYWDETTSFFLIESELDTSSFVRQASKSLSAAHDMVVAFDPADMSAAYFGVLAHREVLSSFFPDLKKVG